jgi:hypothetical protein
MLDICVAQPLAEDQCGRETSLWESPYSDHLIYNPISRGENTWMAHKDGSNAMELDGVTNAQNAHWSSDGKWVVISSYAYRAPGMEVHFLVDTNSKLVRPLEQLTGHTLTFVNFLRPQFSPSGQYLVYAATENPNYELESEYGLYLLDMNTLESERLTDRFGPFQWNADGQGLYVLDNAVYFEFAEDRLAPRKAALYHIDVSNRPAQESLLFDNIDFYPFGSSSMWHWAYSPEAQAIAYVGLQPGNEAENELGVLLLSP